jgi:hypothetical protein
LSESVLETVTAAGHSMVMTRIAPVWLAAALCAGLSLAAPAAAQVFEPPRAVPDETAANRAHVTSGPDATKPAPSEQRDARALAVAVFAKPAAAHRAAEKVEEANAPVIAPAEPKPEWVAKDGVQVGGKGMKVTTPF